jgi:hypothetical protein
MNPNEFAEWLLTQELHLCAAVPESQYPEPQYGVGIVVKGDDPYTGQYVYTKRGSYTWLCLFGGPFGVGANGTCDLPRGHFLYSERRYAEKWPEVA